MISLIIPHFKDQERLFLLLEHLNFQTLAKKYWEVIVVNNDPDLPLVLTEDLSIRYSLRVLEEPKAGSYAARNKGVDAANGEIIGFTDSDMLPEPNWLETAILYFSKDLNREIGILTGPVPLFYKDQERLSWAEIYEKYTGFDFEGYAKEGACGAGNWFSYRSVLEEFGGFREDLKSNGDTELSLRISKKYKVVYVPELVNRHPARYFTIDLVMRYRRIIGGTYERKFKNDDTGFLKHIFIFIWRRYRFAVKKMVTVTPKESIAIWKVCHAINKGAVKEYFDLKSGAETKR